MKYKWRYLYFKNTKELSSDIVHWIPKIPRNIDIVVGIPRSGMLPATLLALHLHKPLASIDQYVNSRTMQAGRRLGEGKTFSLGDPNTSVLVLDDCVRTGRAMREAQSLLENRDIKNEIYYGAVYVTPNSDSIVDCYYEMIPEPQVWEWNIMNHSFLSSACVDIDGVLCRDPTSEEDEDEAAYREFLRTAEPRFIPEVPIQCLVTNRLEMYRTLTERWLERHGIEYERLVMEDLPSKEVQREAKRHVAHKAEAYLESDAELFIESEQWQAAGIARAAAKPVYCVTTGKMIRPDTPTSELRQKSRNWWQLVKRTLEVARQDPLSIPKRAYRIIKSYKF